MFKGTEFLQIGLKHSTLGTVTLYPKAGENGQLKTGGFQNEIDITGSGEPIVKKKRVPWEVECPPIAWNKSGTDLIKTIQDLIDSYEEIDCTFELADGSIWTGKGSIIDELKGATYDGTIPLKISGGGKLAKL